MRRMVVLLGEKGDRRENLTYHSPHSILIMHAEVAYKFWSVFKNRL